MNPKKSIGVTGENSKLYLENPDGTDTLSINVYAGTDVTLFTSSGATLSMYDGVGVHHSQEAAGPTEIVGVSNYANFIMYGEEISDCHNEN